MILVKISVDVVRNNISLSSFMHIVQPRSKTELTRLFEVWLECSYIFTKIGIARKSCLLKVSVNDSKAI